MSANLIYFLVSGKMGVLVVRAPNRGATIRAVRKKYGTIHEPFEAEVADLHRLQEHLHAGCMFFNLDFSIVPPEEAYRRADLPLPSKFQVPLACRESHDR